MSPKQRESSTDPESISNDAVNPSESHESIQNRDNQKSERIKKRARFKSQYVDVIPSPQHSMSVDSKVLYSSHKDRQPTTLNSTEDQNTTDVTCSTDL